MTNRVPSKGFKTLDGEGVLDDADSWLVGARPVREPRLRLLLDPTTTGVSLDPTLSSATDSTGLAL